VYQKLFRPTRLKYALGIGLSEGESRGSVEQRNTLLVFTTSPLTKQHYGISAKTGRTLYPKMSVKRPPSLHLSNIRYLFPSTEVVYGFMHFICFFL
jgi:hypothetical protein